MAHPLGDPRYVRFTTFRRNGEPVHTPVWFAAHGDRYVFETGAAAGKLKRLRHTDRVEVTRSDVRGRTRPGTPIYTGRASVLPPDEERAAVATLAKKYGWQWRLIRLGDVARRLVGRDTTSPIVVTELGEQVGTA